MEDPSKESLGKLCPKHIGEVINFYCTKCREPGCTVCIMYAHSSHPITCFPAPGWNEGTFGSSGLYLPPEFTVEGCLKCMSEKLCKIDLHPATAQIEIRSCALMEKRSLDAEKKSLEAHIAAVKSAKINYILVHQRNVTALQEDIKKTVSCVRKFIDYKDHVKLLESSIDLTRRLMQLQLKCSQLKMPDHKDLNIKSDDDDDDRMEYMHERRVVTFSEMTKSPTATAQISFFMRPEPFKTFTSCCLELLNNLPSSR
ncbi:uncharacterized protein [Dysidea avara]|uniref:uncharacterized protein n=1 Tax=Dysidea avara TaxID=196820 RepID=UPI0033279AA1